MRGLKACLAFHSSMATLPVQEKETAMAGHNEFAAFSVPLVFNHRYFIMERGNPPLLTVVSEEKGEPFFEVFKNEPRENPHSEAIKSTTGIVTVSPKKGGTFLYRIHPGPETKIALVKPGGGEITAKIGDDTIHVGGITLRNNAFIGDMTGVSLMPDGAVSIGARIPRKIMQWLKYG